MADRIQLLPDHVANQIAAGEVVQRPSSVVKELLENAIDAGANQIDLIVRDAGKTLIQVIDNGCGMTETDARMCFERHATSKIKSADDLFNIHTKGFRGEAMASIAAISHVDLKSRRPEDELGSEIRIEGSKVISQEIVGSNPGTSISVKNLFFNVPARRNFLKSDSVELRHIIDEFHRVALAHPEISFSMHHNANELFNLKPANHRQRIVNVFGSKSNEKLVPVNEETEIVKISGFVSKPEFAKKTRGEQFFFVNNRFIKSPYLNHSVNAAFEGLLKEGTHAGYFLFLSVDPSTIDVNIHPTKTEIKFEDEHTIYAILRSAIKHSLGQFNIAPLLDFDRDPSMDTPYKMQGKSASSPRIDVDRSFNPFGAKGAGSLKSTGSWESLYVGLKDSSDPEEEHDQMGFEVESDPKNLTVFGDEESVPEIKAFQLHKKYIVNAIKSGLVIIDQYRAHQRVLYEGFLRSMTVKEAVSQQMMFPLKLNLSTLEVATLKGMRSQLEQSGFIFNVLDHDEVELSGLPLNVEVDKVGEILDRLISDTDSQVPGMSFSQSDLIAKSLSKTLSIKRGQKLTLEEQEHLVNSLFACKEPSVSPDNKPTFVTMSNDELNSKFL